MTRSRLAAVACYALMIALAAGLYYHTDIAAWSARVLP